ncbi:MAG: GNAT family N-acetyltransferase [Gemmataceae bacterium]|nr:GNAT family N-acetyltransferase [Gemmataceae bacterium]MDW8243372.1 GNAT family N-acetyltransferase [Thermogemmata sp.]
MAAIIRPAQESDLATLVEFNRALAWETERKVLDPTVVTAGVTALLRDSQRGFYTVADWQGQVVGQLLITYEWSDWRNGWFWWLQSVYVHPEYRRRGIFRALLQAIEQLAYHRGDVVGLRLYVEQSNTAAQAAYATLGLQPTTYGILEKSLR